MATKSTTYPTPQIVDRSAWQSELDQLLVREKAHTREGDAIAAARRRLPMVEVDAATPVVGADGEVPLIDVFEGRTAADRLLPHVARGKARCGTVRGLHVLHRARAGAVLSAQPRCHVCDVLSGPLRRERAVPGLHGVGDAVVLGARRARRVDGGRAISASMRAICATVTASSRRTGRRVAARRPAPTAITYWTSPCMAGRRSRRTHPRAGRSRSTRAPAISSAPTIGPPLSGRGSPRAVRTTSRVNGSPTRRARASPRA